MIKSLISQVLINLNHLGYYNMITRNRVFSSVVNSPVWSDLKPKSSQAKSHWLESSSQTKPSWTTKPMESMESMSQTKEYFEFSEYTRVNTFLLLHPRLSCGWSLRSDARPKLSCLPCSSHVIFVTNVTNAGLQDGPLSIWHHGQATHVGARNKEGITWQVPWPPRITDRKWSIRITGGKWSCTEDHRRK